MHHVVVNPDLFDRNLIMPIIQQAEQEVLVEMRRISIKFNDDPKDHIDYQQLSNWREEWSKNKSCPTKM